MSHTDAERLTRPDGAVIVPPAIAGEVLRALVRDLTARVRADGGEVAPEVRRVLYALHTAAQHAETFDSVTVPFDSSATGSAAGPSGTVCVAEAAALMGCTPRHVRALIAAGRLPAERVGARVWAIDTAALNHYRHHRGETAA
ncbi:MULTISPECIES: excisionase family DNA-binding protein [Streptomyces]|uniref:excisionase family DNA-binding protein n=1 Tax=Streptomyces TaxID=1883 RepID=UPI00069B964B|nr:excisionase family DNA-binding protein [Streptomyces sp. SID7805]WSK14036.1 helix-turn-helix domain-containing protein [Streptomyces celluloflavus]